MLCTDRKALTDQGLLAQIFSFGVVLFPLEESKRLVDEWQDIHAYRPLLLLHLNRGLELSNRIVELLLIEQQFAVVVVNVGHLLEVFDDATERGHRRSDGSELILRYAELNVREDKVLVQVDRLLVVSCGFLELALNEVELGAMVVDIWVLGVPLDGFLEIAVGLFLFA